MSSTDLANPIPFTDIVKYDALGNNGNGKNYVWKSHGIIGEPCFVPRSRKKSSNLSETEIHQRIPDEDDGWVIAQVYVAESHRTDFVILDARNVDNGPVAIIQLQHHIPYGFHGTWADRVFYNDFPETLCTSRL